MMKDFRLHYTPLIRAYAGTLEPWANPDDEYIHFYVNQVWDFENQLDYNLDLFLVIRKLVSLTTMVQRVMLLTLYDRLVTAYLCGGTTLSKQHKLPLTGYSKKATCTNQRNGLSMPNGCWVSRTNSGLFIIRNAALERKTV